MEKAVEEMRKLNRMIAEADETKAASQPNHPDAPGIVDTELKEKAEEPDLHMKTSRKNKSVETSNSPISSKSPTDASNHAVSPFHKQEPALVQRFTSFDQLVPLAKDEDGEEDQSLRPPPLTIHNASVTIHDDATADNGRLRNKPTWEYLVQIEPSSSHHSGWMIMKTYAQFESLHESIRRIAAISGATAFLEAHQQFPSWKLHTRSSLRGEMERYMRNACVEKSLAESEAMKRFLDRGQEPKMGVNRGFSFESMGKGMLDVIQNAPKGALDSGKVVMGGVTGVFGNIGLGPKRSTNGSLQETQTTQGRYRCLFFRESILSQRQMDR
jgi:hypothetical protein